MRLRRSVLVSPGFDRRKLEKAAQSDADCVWIELEDGAPPERKREARDTAAAALSEIDWRGKERHVRVNSVDSRWFEDDLRALVPARPEAIILAKVSGPDDVQRADRLITQLDGGPAESAASVRLGSMIETPRAVCLVSEIAMSSPRLSALWFGAADYSYEMGFPFIDLGSMGPITSLEGLQPELLYAKSAVVTAARAFGLYAIDVAYHHGHRDLEGCYRDARWSFRLGFAGKMVVSPAQIAPVHSAFAPSPELIEWARAGAKRSTGNELGAGGALGEDYHGPFAKSARRLLETAAAIAAQGAERGTS